MMYVYGLGVIEKHGTGDTNDVFVCEHRGDMNRLAARLNQLNAENAALREQLAEAVKILDVIVDKYALSTIDESRALEAIDAARNTQERQR